LSQEGHDFAIAPFLSLLGIKDKLDGKANFKINVSASGNTSDQLFRTLSGNVKLGINQGKFYGFDAVKQLKATQTKIYGLVSSLTGKDIGNTASMLTDEQGKWQNDGQQKAFTAFDTLQMDATFSNGISNQSSFSILHSEYHLNGDGQLNLINQTLQYRASLLLTHNPYPSNNEIGTAVFGLPLPILITGALTNPTIRPDLKTYFDSAFKLTQKKVVEKVIDQTIHKALDQLLKGAIGG
jgi:AsmA protein